MSLSLGEVFFSMTQPIKHHCPQIGSGRPGFTGCPGSGPRPPCLWRLPQQLSPWGLWVEQEESSGVLIHVTPVGLEPPQERGRKVITRLLPWASLVAQWLRIYLPMQGTRVRALVREDPACRGATKPVRHNYQACALEPASHSY